MRKFFSVFGNAVLKTLMYVILMSFAVPIACVILPVYLVVCAIKYVYEKIKNRMNSTTIKIRIYY